MSNFLVELEDVRADQIIEGDYVLNVNGWWHVIHVEPRARTVWLHLGQIIGETHPYKYKLADLVTRRRKQQGEEIGS